jgi:hypothetical protein
MANTIQLRRGAASQWTSANTVLASGELGFETDTNKFKIGTGTASWSELAYAAIDIATASSLYLPLSGSVNWSNINDKPDLTITLGGDLSGSVTFTDLASGTLNAEIIANSVALGTDTTGDYVSGLTAGDGISITGTAGEGWSPTVSINSSTASVTFANITSKPTTLSGYGITDALPSSASSNFLPISSSSNFAPLTTIINSSSATSYTLVASDAGELIEINSADTNTLIIPLNSSVPFPVGTKIDILQVGAGQVTASADSGVTINSKDGNTKLTGQWSAASLVKRETDSWVLIGDLSA